MLPYCRSLPDHCNGLVEGSSCDRFVIAIRYSMSTTGDEQVPRTTTTTQRLLRTWIPASAYTLYAVLFLLPFVVFFPNPNPDFPIGYAPFVGFTIYIMVPISTAFGVLQALPQIFLTRKLRSKGSLSRSFLAAQSILFALLAASWCLRFKPQGEYGNIDWRATFVEWYHGGGWLVINSVISTIASLSILLAILRLQTQVDAPDPERSPLLPDD